MSKVLRNFYIREDQDKELNKRSSEKRSRAKILRDALDQYFKTNKK